MSKIDAVILACLAGIAIGTLIGLAIARRDIGKWILFPCRWAAR